MARSQLVLGHVQNTTYSGGANKTTIRKQYTATVLPEPPARGSIKPIVACSECHNTYQIRIDSPSRYRILAMIQWVVFPLLVLAAMIVPALMGQPNSWIIYFVIAIAGWSFFRYNVRKHGYGRVKRVGKREAKYAPHELFDPQKIVS